MFNRNESLTYVESWFVSCIFCNENCPHPPLPERKGGEKPRKFLFPSPKGRGARGEDFFYIDLGVCTRCINLGAIAQFQNLSLARADDNHRLHIGKFGN